MAASLVLAQDILYDQVHNATTIIGTWSSGSKAVQTGSGFVSPANQTFIYPKTSGISYSFDENYYYEIARYRFVSNASDPNCITGVVNWVHGKYSLEGNGSIVLTPLGDGFQQIQDPCAAVSNFLENYNITELISSWRIFLDAATGGYKLHLFAFDGAPMAPQFQISATPNMLPTRLLRNMTAAKDAQLTVQKRDENSASRNVLSASVVVVAAGLASILL
ncbi:chaperone for protein-folding within the ER, fungal-domain-containing protein [Mycena floridula]|nr:chaperone for protein-folding within the ER, fungal-domain-containing protein [Mycena floridula]